jgi:hypothetical protein
MTQADSVHSTPPLTTSASSALTEVAHELFNLEERFLRVRNLTYAVRMAASSVEISKEPTDAIEALTDTILDEIGELIEERRRLCHLASGHEEGADGDPRPIKGDGPMKAPGCSSEFDGVIGLSETLCVFDELEQEGTSRARRLYDSTLDSISR